jgi:hypothetical protein
MPRTAHLLVKTPWLQPIREAIEGAEITTEDQPGRDRYERRIRSSARRTEPAACPPQNANESARPGIPKAGLGRFQAQNASTE